MMSNNMQSPELETLDQLLGGDLPIGVIRGFYESEERFCRASMAMLRDGHIRLHAPSAIVGMGRHHK